MQCGVTVATGLRIVDAMGTQRLRADQIRVGLPLPFDAFDGHGRLLLRRGAVLQHEEQLLRLIEQGLFREEDDSDGILLDKGYMPSYSGRRVSVAQVLNDARAALRALLQSPQRPDFADAVLEIAANIRRGVRLDADAACGSIVLSTGQYYPARQSVNTAVLCSLVLDAVKATDATALSCMAAALTMNIAMVDLQEVLYHRVAALSEAEQAEVREHPARGRALLAQRGVTDALWLDAVAQHHELADGSGYPQALRGDAISRYARLLAVADQVCALISERASRPGLNPAVVVGKLRGAEVPMFDATVRAAVVQVLGPWPPGAPVELANGEAAIVVRRSTHAAHPIVMACVSGNRIRFPEPRKRITSQAGNAVTKPLPMNAIAPWPRPDQLWDKVLEN